MVDKILASTRGKPCSCPEHKHCVGCKLKRLKPQVYLEEPDKLEIPIVISHYKPKKTVTIKTTTEKRPIWKKKEKHKTTTLDTGLCNWYKKRLAQKQLQLEYKKEQKRLRQEVYEKTRKEREQEIKEQKRLRQEAYEKARKEREKEIKEQKRLRQEAYEKQLEHKNEQKRLRQEAYEKQLEHKNEQKRLRQEAYEKARKEREQEFLEQLRRQEQYKNQQQSVVKQLKVTTPKLAKKSRPAKSTIAKPKIHSKRVTVTRYNHYQSFGERFVNCFYRACCQFLCCVSLLVAVTFVVVILF